MFGRIFFKGLAIGCGAVFAAVAGADQVFPGDPDWVSADNSGGGSSEITDGFGDQHGGAGSLELQGDRTRFYGLGNPWASTGGLGLLSDLNAFSFDWAVAGDSVSGLGADYSPALRLHIYDPANDLGLGRNNNIELIWEGAYNGVGGISTDTWYTTSTNDDFWRWEGSLTLDNGAQVNQSLSDWATGEDSTNTRWFSDDATIMAVSIGVGSSVGSDYHAYADYLTLGFSGQTATVYDFEPHVVPVPPAFAAGLLGIAALAVRRKLRRS